MRRIALIAFFAVIGTIGSVFLGVPAPSRAVQATPVATAAPAPISSEIFAAAQPVAVANPELALGRVTIMPGAAIPPHIHPGTQIGVVVQGELTYTVFSGEVGWRHASAPDAPPTVIAPGETVTVLVGDAVIEPPGAVHQGRNDGAVPVVIYLSTLFPAGEPRSTIVEATPEA